MRLGYLLIFVALISCKKEPSAVKKTAKLYYEASYWIVKPCNQDVGPDSVQYIDSVVLFTNKSRWSATFPDTIPSNPDTNYIKTFKWDFGDNTFSTNQHTSHIYSRPGIYKVSLITYLNNIASDTFSRQMRILVGQREIKTAYTYTTCIDIDEASNNSFLLLLSSYNSLLDPPLYSLMKLDSLFKPIWNKPLAGNNIRLNSLKKIGTNEYILSGNFTSGNTEQFAITRITENGDLIWTKYINNLSGRNVYTMPTSDGNILTIGDTSSSPNPSFFPVIVKCTANGDEIWRRSFNTGLNTSIRTPDNIIETNNGYVFAATKPGGSNGKIVLTALDLNGNTVQQVETDAGNWGTVFRAGVVKSGPGYMIYPTNSLAVYFFTDNLIFSSSVQLASASGINHAFSFNGMLYVADGSHQYSSIKQLSGTGSEIWHYPVRNNIFLSCSSMMSGATRYCKKVLCTANDVIALSYGQNNSSGFNSSSVYIEKINYNDGGIK